MGLFHKDSGHAAKDLIDKTEKFKEEVVGSEDFRREYENLSKIVNVSLEKILGLHYKFTYEDIKNELPDRQFPINLKMKIEDLCNSMGTIEFRTEIKTGDLVDAADKLISLLTVASNIIDHPELNKQVTKKKEEPVAIKLVQEEEFRPKGENVFESMPSSETLNVSDNIKMPEQGFTVGDVKKVSDVDADEPPAIKKPDLEELPKMEDDRLAKLEDAVKDFEKMLDEKPKKAEKKPAELKPISKAKRPVKKLKEPPKIVPLSTKPVEVKAVERPAEIKSVKVLKPIEKQAGVKELPKVAEKPAEIKPIKVLPEKPPQVKAVKELPKKPVKKLRKPRKTKKSIKKSVKKGTKPAKRIVKKAKPVVKKHKSAKKLRIQHKLKKKKGSVKDTGLPKFKLKVVKKGQKFKKNLVDVIKDLEKGKRDVAEEIKLIEEQTKVLKKEKKLVQRKKAFKSFIKDVKTQLDKLVKQKKELTKKEENINRKIEAAQLMEKHLKELSKKLDHDEKAIKRQARYVKAKEKVLKTLKSELNKKYKIAVREVEKLRKNLKEKEQNFLKLQKFYQLRENKLAVEEEHFFREKRQYRKLISDLLRKHMDAVLKDLNITEKNLKYAENKTKERDARINYLIQMSKKLAREKHDLKKEIEDKRLYFNKIEEEFRARDPEFAKLNEAIVRKNKSLLERETALTRFETELDKTKAQLGAKVRRLELKDLDLRAIEKEIDKILFNIKNNHLRLSMRERHLNKRIDSYYRLKRNIQNNIKRERKVVLKLERRLNRKQNYIDNKLEKSDQIQKGQDIYQDFVYNQDLTEPETPAIAKIGHPAVLDILRLLNIAKKLLVKDPDKAKETYLEIQRIFDDLEEEDRERIYPEIVRVFKPKETLVNDDNIDTLIEKFGSSINQGDIKMSEEIYAEIQKEYSKLPEDKKTKYFSKIMGLYNKILDHQVSTGVV